MERIAVWNTAFLGDAVLTLPLLQSLRAYRPEARIDFYVRKGLETLFAPHPAVDAVVPVDKKSADPVTFLLRTGRMVSREHYDLWISAHTSMRSGLVALSSKAPRRIGYDFGLTGRLAYTQTVDRCFGRMDEPERLLQLLGPLGATPLSTWPEVALAPEAEADAAAFFARMDAPVLGMHPGSVWPTKRWPGSYFAEIGRRAATHGAYVLLFAGPGEEKMAQEVLGALLPALPAQKHHLVRDLAGTLPLPLLAAYIKHLSCYLTNDSGPMHLAWAQHTPVSALFGPTVRQLGFFPRGEEARVHELDLACRPCGLHGPKQCPLGHHHCMKQLTPDMVWPDVEQKLFQARSRIGSPTA